MDTSRDYSTLAKALSLSLPSVFRTLVSALPIFLGYACLGTALFWQSNRFASTSQCLTTLYSLMFGDMIYDTFHDIGESGGPY